MNFEFDLILPSELKKEFQLLEILLVKNTSVICLLKKKTPLTETHYILKIIPTKQYNELVYENLSSFSDGGILTAVQEYHTKHFVYFIFPKLQSLNYLVKSGKMDFHQLKILYSDIGKTLLFLHQKNIFHMDLSPSNIYLSEDGHFLLGDFSSSFLKEEKRDHPFLKKHRTGSTKGFYPKNISPYKSPVNYDIYGYFMILFLLINRGKTPFEKENSIRKITYEKEYNIEKKRKSNDFEKISSFLSETLSICNTKYLPTDFFEKKYFELGYMMNEVKEQKILNSFQVKISDFENSLFCSFTEPEKRNYFSFLNPFLSDCPFFKRKANFFSIPKFLFSKEKRTTSFLYGLLLFCGLLFLFTCYHTLLNTNRSNKSLQVKANMQITKSSGSSIILSDQDFKSPDPTDTLFQDNTTFQENPPAKITETPEKNIVSSVTRSKNYLDLTGKDLKDSSFLSESEQTEEIQIIFAPENKFPNISSFLLFQNLKELYLNRNSISSISTSETKELKKLEILDLSENKLKDISALSYLKHLKLLDLSGQKHLKNLMSIKKIRTLEYLIVTNTNISKKEISYLKKKLPACTIIY